MMRIRRCTVYRGLIDARTVERRLRAVWRERYRWEKDRTALGWPLGWPAWEGGGLGGGRTGPVFSSKRLEGCAVSEALWLALLLLQSLHM